MEGSMSMETNRSTSSASSFLIYAESNISEKRVLFRDDGARTYQMPDERSD
jgi:hypothetical protein